MTRIAIVITAVVVAIMTATTAPAQLFRWSYYNAGNCTTCSNGKCGPSKPVSDAIADKDDKSHKDAAETPQTAAEGPLTRLFDGVDADRWENAVKEVCELRGIKYEALLQKQRSPITCTASPYASYAGCTWSAGDGQVARVDVVKTSCYDYDAVLRHEASHVVTFLTQSNTTLFVHEGLAQVCERAGKRRAYLNYSRSYINDSTNLIDWVTENDYSRGYAVYSISFATFEYLREVGGSRWLEAFARDVDRTRDFKTQLQRWYGLSDKQLSDNVRMLIDCDKIKTLL